MTLHALLTDGLVQYHKPVCERHIANGIIMDCITGYNPRILYTYRTRHILEGVVRCMKYCHSNRSVLIQGQSDRSDAFDRAF